jgi:shikimate kinase
VWREARVRELLSGSEEGTLFISGCAENMGRLFPLIDCIILLSAPVETIVERLETRSPGGYGHVAEERQKVVELISTIEPLLRKSADQEIDTRKPLRVTVDEILQISRGFPSFEV